MHFSSLVVYGADFLRGRNHWSFLHRSYMIGRGNEKLTPMEKRADPLFD
jgi:hypothetical protein